MTLDRKCQIGAWEYKYRIDQGPWPSLSVIASAVCGEGRSLCRGRKGKHQLALSLEVREVTTEGTESPEGGKQMDLHCRRQQESNPVRGNQLWPQVRPTGHLWEKNLRRIGSLSEQEEKGAAHADNSYEETRFKKGRQ